MKLPEIQYQDNIGGKAKRDISQPLRVAGARAGAANAQAGAAGAMAGAAGKEAQAARAMSALYMKGAETVTNVEDYFLEQEATRQVQEAQSKQKIALKELTEKQDRKDPETGEAAWKSLPNYKEQQSAITEGITEDMNPRARAQFDPWATQANDANMMSHMGQADAWRREDNKLQAYQQIDVQEKSNQFDQAKATNDQALDQQTISPAEHWKNEQRIDNGSTMYTHSETTDVLITNRNTEALDQHIEQISNDPAIKQSQRKQLRTEAISKYSESLVTTYTDDINAVVERGGLANGVKRAEALFNEQLKVNTQDYPGGPETHAKVLSDLRTRRNYYKSLLEKNTKFSSKSVRLFGVENGDYKAAPDNDFNKDVTDTVAIRFRGHVLNGKKVELTENSRTDKEILSTPAKSAEEYMNLKVIKNQGYADSWLKGLGEGLFDVDKSAEEQSQGLTMLAKINDINPTFLATSKFSDETLEFVSLATQVGPENATKLIRAWREKGAQKPPETFNKEFSEAFAPDKYVQMQKNWWPDKDVSLNLQDTADVKRLAGKYYSMFGNTEKSVEYAAKAVASRKVATNMGPTPTTVDAHNAVEAHPSVIKLGKDSGRDPTEITSELKDQLNFKQFDTGMTAPTVTVNNAAPNDKGQILVNVTGFDSELGIPVTSPQLVDLNTTNAQSKAHENRVSRAQKNKESAQSSEAVQGLAAVEADQGIRIDSYVLGTDTQKKLEGMGFTEQDIRAYLDYKLKYTHKAISEVVGEKLSGSGKIISDAASTTGKVLEHWGTKVRGAATDAMEAVDLPRFE